MADAASPAPIAGTRRLDPMDVFSFCHVAEVQISPDASRLCYVLVRRDRKSDNRRSTLMLSSDRRTWQEVPDSAGCSTPRWAPDSRRLAFLRRAGGRTALVVHDATTGAQHTLIETAEPLREIAGSPDGTQVAFQMHTEEKPPAWVSLPQAPDYATWAPAFRITTRLIYRHDTIGDLAEGAYQIYVASADGSSTPRAVTSGMWFSGFIYPPGLTWSADGAEVLLAASRQADWDMAPSEIDIYGVRAADGAVRRLTQRPGAEASVAVSPDGRWIAYTGVEDRKLSSQLRRLFMMDARTGATRELLATLDRSIDTVAWRGDSAALFVSFDDTGRRAIGRVTLDGELKKLVSDVGGPGIEMPYAGGGFSVARDGTVAYVRTSVTVPAEVAVVSPDGAVATLTDLHGEFAAAIGGFADAENFWMTCADGHRMECWLMLPKVGGRHPLILEIHGGPFAQYGDRFSIKHQMLAAAGYAVLFANPRGSTGYGEDFANALHDRYPGPDYDDLMALVDAVAARPDIDGGEIFITGISGGGTLTCWAVTHTHRFRAAVAIKPVVDWESWTLTADIGPIIGRIWLGGALPWEAPQKLRDRSPIAHVGAARTPTMLIAGDADSRTPLSEAQQMYAALKLAGVEAALVRGPGVSHSSGALRPSHFAAEVMCTLAWFDRFRIAM
jgi:dipeptidyl aminopeptidase/acylaminoacyl peptidase